MTQMETKSNKAYNNAIDYANAVTTAENGDVGFLAWRFLIGCRILECLEDMEGCPEIGTDVQVRSITKTHSILRLGNYEISVAHKPEGQVKPLIEPNSK